MGKGAGKGRGDDSSSSSDETDAKVKRLYYIICLLAGLALCFAAAVGMLVWAKQQSGKTTPLGKILPATVGYKTLGQKDLREFDDPQIVQVTHPNFNGMGTDNTVIYCTSGTGLPSAEVPCESANIMYNDASRFRMAKNGAYACIFCTEGELCSDIVEQHYAINSKPPTIQPLADSGTSQLSLQKKKFELSFSVAYRWDIMAAVESIVYYTNASTAHGGDVSDCDKIQDSDFEQCPLYPKVPCWPPVVKASRASKIFRYDDKKRPLMDSSVCIGAITKVRDMNIGTTKPSVSYSEMRYLVEEVAEVRVEPCLQDAKYYTSYTKDITMWTSTPGAKIKYTIDYASTCLGVISGKGKNPLSNDAKASCNRVLRDAKGVTLNALWTKEPKMLNPAFDSSAQLYKNPISIPHTARLLAVGTHPSNKIQNGMLSVCDYEVVVAAPTCTEEAGSAWMGVSKPTGAPQAPKTNTNQAIIRFLSPTRDSTVHFQYCDVPNKDGTQNCKQTWKYDPKNPPIIYQSAQIQAWSTKSKLRPSKYIRCTFVVKSAPPLFSTPSNYLTLGEPGGTWKTEGCIGKGKPDDSCIIKLDKVASRAGSPSEGGPAAPNVVPGVPTADSFFTLNTRIQLSQWSYSQCDDARTAQLSPPIKRGCLHADHFKLLYRETKECCTQDPKEAATVNDEDGKPIDCAWKIYTKALAQAGGIELTESKQICTMAKITGNSLDSDVRTANFFVYAEAPTYNKASYTKYINEMKVCASTTTPGASVFYKTAKSTLMSGFKGPIPDRLATYDKNYQFKTTRKTGLTDIALSSGCVTLAKSTLVSAVTVKSTINGSKLAPSHRNQDREHAGRLRPADVGMATKSWYYVEVDQPVISPDQRDTSLWNDTGPVYKDQDGNKNGELYDSQEITIVTNAKLPVSDQNQAGVTIKYAIERYHCTDPDGGGPLDISSSMLECPLSERAKIATQMQQFAKCNMYDPAHTCKAQARIKASVGKPADATGACAALELVYNSTAKKSKYTVPCQSWMSVKYPKEAQYVMTCNGLSDSAAGALTPYSGCEFQTYKHGDKPVVDISSQAYSFAEKDGLERSPTAMMEFEITVNAPTISPCGVPPGYWADGSKKLHYVGPTSVELTSPVGPSWRTAIEGRADAKLWSDKAKNALNDKGKVTIHQRWSTSQWHDKYAGVEIKQPGTATTSSKSPPKKECGATQGGSACTGSAKYKYDWLAEANDNGLGSGSTRYEYAYRGKLIGQEKDTRLDTNPVTANNGGTKHRPRLFNDAIPTVRGQWAAKDTFEIVEIGTLFTYASKPGLTNSPMSSCEYEIQTTPPDWFQSGEICKEVSGGKLSIPVCLSPALFGSGFVFLYSEPGAEVHYELRDNSVADVVTRTSPIFAKWIQLVAKGSTFFYSLKSYAIKKGMWDSREINQPFVVVTEVSRGAIPTSNLPSDVSSVVCRDCDVTNILFGKPGQFWGAEYTTVPSGVVSITMDFPGDWQEAFNECGDKSSAQTAAQAKTAYLITTVYLAYPFIPDPARGYARSASACPDFEIEILQSVRDQNCKKSDDKDIYGKQTCIKDGVRQSWEIGGETFASDGKRQTCAPNATNVAPSCWRNTVAADSQNRFRDTDSFTPPQPVRGQALRYSCKKLPFYLESWVVYGIAGNSLDTSDTAGGACKYDGDKDGILDCKKQCMPQKYLGDGTCDDGTNDNTGKANYNCVSFLYDKMDCFKLDAGGGSTDLTAVFNKMYEGYDGPGCTNC